MAPSSSAAAAATKLLVEITTDGIPKLHCPVCNKALVSLAGYVKHVKKHQPPGGFECRHCDARFCHEEELTQHAKDEHGVTGAVAGQERKPFVCEKCGAEYKYQEAYRRHCRTKCGEEKLPRVSRTETVEPFVNIILIITYFLFLRRNPDQWSASAATPASLAPLTYPSIDAVVPTPVDSRNTIRPVHPMG